MAGEKILVVDDELQIVRLAIEVLTGLGYVVQGVTSGQEALARLETEPFDLLVVDIRIPDVDGLVVLRQARGLDPNLTAVVVTGYATMDRAIEALHAGARGFLLKPFDFDEMISAVEAALAQRRREQERLSLRSQLPILEISQTMMTEGSVESLADRLLEVVVRQMGAERAAILLLDEKADELYVAAAAGLPAEPTGKARIPVGQDFVGRVLRAEGPVVVDTESRPSLEPPLEAFIAGTAMPNATLAFVPLRTGKKEIGVLGLGRTPEARGRLKPMFSPSELNLLSIVGGQIAVALENARMYAQEQQRIAALARALEQQRELDRLRDQFINNVSHELRTPLALIMGYAELLASGDLGELQPEQQGPMATVLQQTMALRTLVDNVTTLLENRSREPVRELVSLAETVSTSVADFRVLADQSDLELRGEIAAKVPPVLGDSQQVRRVVDNLIGNALKFTPAGGTVTLSLHSADDEVVLQVADTGIGIAQEHLPRIFDRFYQVNGTIRRSYGGSGLGLALVKEIVEAHGGRVTVESQVGQGSTFTVRLPVAPAYREAKGGT